MLELKSVSKPVPSALESIETEPLPQRKVYAGGKGSGPIAKSRAEDALVVVGKGKPIRRPAGGALETVLGVDDRVRVLETDLPPWRMVCALRMFAPGGAAIGTGWLAGPQTIVTAGHCVHHTGFFGGWASRIEISAGRNGDDFPFDTVVSTRFSSLDRWVQAADPDFDIGCIHLDQPLGDKTGWFGFGSLPDTELESHLVNISGYPSDRGQGRDQYFHANRILAVGNRRIFYDVDTFGGQSGAPVWIQATDGAEPLVVAVHAYGTGGTPLDLGITANSAPRILPEVFDLITSWVETDSGVRT